MNDYSSGVICQTYGDRAGGFGLRIFEPCLNLQKFVLSEEAGEFFFVNLAGLCVDRFNNQ